MVTHAASSGYGMTLLVVFAFASAILLTIAIGYGIGAHQVQLTADQIIAAVKWSWFDQILGIFAIGTGKLAIVAFLHQIHGPEHRGRLIFLWTVGVSNVLINCVTIGMIMTQCSPRQKLWDDRLPGSCDGRLRNQNTAYFQGTLYPVVFFWNVRINIRVKIGLCVLMGLGIIAIPKYLRVLSETQDVTYYIAQLIAWHETEKWVVLIVGCIPPTRPLLVMIFQNIFNTHMSSSGVQTGKATKSFELQSFSNPTKQSARSRHTTPGMSILDRQDSEESILPTEDGIMKTTNISLHYESGSASREGGEHDGQVMPNERI
ncbi:uncharacterized protein N7482_009082 [Penicillium canariense]|uniref:Rhodopsin domain-containing protein n=1 Tax=Penicillium canariense TaxID=189055 RepID=A0A9W9LFD0_9EURO|nr:uncharacterized protein N7482_009082 [Penicillium canariense]KAJ5152604.1 hypothetical protein N7482_009082 [Penicillium canariense]